MDSTQPASKTCSLCHRALPLDQFFPRRDRPGQYLSGCKPCRSEIASQRYQANRPPPQQLALAPFEKLCTKCHRLLPAEMFGERSDLPGFRRSHCYECRRVAKREYDESHVEKRREASRAYYRANAEVIGQRVRASIAKKPEFYKVIHSTWKHDNKDAVNAATHRRRSRELYNGGSWTKDDWLKLKAQYDWRCLGCGKQEMTDGIKLCFDHIIPLSLGGWNIISNGQPVCRSCNSLKHTKVLDLRDKRYPFKKRNTS